MYKRAVILAVFLTLCLTYRAEASTGGIFYSQTGDVYLSGSGWVHAEGNTYYVHRTESACYPKGSVTRDAYRWRGRKLYYFTANGTMLTESDENIILNCDHSVCYILTPGTDDERYCVRSQHYQVKRNGHWHDTGMQTNIWWCCDWQL